MKLEEALIRLNEDDIFGKVHSVDIEESDIMKNLGILGNMINEAIETLRGYDRLICEDAEALSKLEMECLKWMGSILEKIEKYK